MKISTLRAEITVDAETKAIAIIITILANLAYPADKERILNTVATRFGYKVAR